ncbi:Fe-S cluster assembly protein SufB [Candidatus Woesearchaeota archaeon]|nr:MAG: Fe-S cluster assembly protein SufB [Candidatus Woesearchaeota archaeon]
MVIQIERKEELYKPSKAKIAFDSGEGLSKELIEEITRQKKQPDWMKQIRLKAYDLFLKTPMPAWGPDLSGLDLNRIKYFIRPDAKQNAKSWEEVPEYIKETFDKLGIPEAEREQLAGVGAQYESDVVYHSLLKELEDMGVIFVDMDVAVRKYPELVKEYFMTKAVPVNLHKFTMLHAAVWSGGTFLYVPRGVKVKKPLQSYFRMNSVRAGQFEHTLIIAEEGSEVHYIEGCSAPQYFESSLHAGCVEIIVKKNARVRYSSVENWSRNTYNLNTKRAIVEENGVMEWVSGNLGSGTTMLYPATILKGDNSTTSHLSIAYAGPGQNQDVGAKVYHIGKNTSSTVTSKSISSGGGITAYRGTVFVSEKAVNASVSVNCDALMTDNKSQSNTFPGIIVKNPTCTVAHEATCGKISDEKIFYLTSRGISEEEALKMIVLGFIEPIVKQLPLEYAVELNRLIELEMEGSLG